LIVADSSKALSAELAAASLRDDIALEDGFPEHFETLVMAHFHEFLDSNAVCEIWAEVR
jgi:hypothetical protein